MKEIKSVRVRRRDVKYGTLDIKVTIFEEKHTFKAEQRVVMGTNNDRPIWMGVYYPKKGLYKDYTDDQFIKDFIDMNSKSDGGGKTYDIIQDPWEIKTPKWRSYGYDPYYLNNGAQIFISWTEGNFTAGGLTYSDDSGKEINASVSISKTVSNIIGIDEPSMLQYGKNQEIEYKSFDKPTQVYGGLFDDLSIIREIIDAWKRKVPNYNELALCSPDNQSCSIIPYKSPLKPPEPEVPPTEKVATNNEPPKEKMTVVLPPDVIKVKNDITSFVIYVGKVKEKGLLENPSIEQDEFIFDDSTGELDEYTEAEFEGNPEASVSEEQEYASEEIRQETEKQSEVINNTPYVPGKYTLDMIPGTFYGNNKMPITCCQIDGKPVNVKIADAVLDLKAAAQKDGVTIRVNSGFRPDFYPNVSTKSKSGVSVSAQSQEELYAQNCKGGVCSPDTARPGNSKHGSGIAVDFNTGSRTGKIKSPLDPKVYSWMVKNSWRFGFYRTVKSEEWHFEYWGKLSGPYSKLPKSNNLFYADLGLNNLSVVA
jgi:LAS superfamily LD-carboxypeptidase LdcB